MPTTGSGLHSTLSQQSSLLKRVLENLESVWTVPRIVTCSSLTHDEPLLERSSAP